MQTEGICTGYAIEETYKQCETAVLTLLFSISIFIVWILPKWEENTYLSKEIISAF